jgi:hypothetical protein
MTRRIGRLRSRAKDEADAEDREPNKGNLVR